MDKKKNKLVLCELLICILVVCIIFILKKQLLLFETNDDQTMIDIVSGNFGISSFYMIYSNFLYGYLLKFLYMIFNDINWYILISTIFSIICSYLVLNSLTDYKNTYKNIIVCSVLIFILYDLFSSFNYTKLAGFISVSGILTIYDNYESANGYFFLGLFVAFMGSLIRFESFAIVLLFFSLLFLEKIIKNKRIIISKSLIILIVSLLASTSLYLINKSMFKDFNEFNKYRTNILDYSLYDNDHITISDNDYKMLETWTFEDRNVFNTNYFVDLSNENSVSIINVLKSCVINGLYALKNYGIAILTALLCIIALFDYHNDTKFKIMAIFSFLFAYFLLNYMGRVIYRAEMMLWISLLFTLIKFTSLNKISAIIYVIAFSIMIAKQPSTEIEIYYTNKEKRNELIDYTSNNLENIYLIDTFTSLEYFYPTLIYEIMPNNYMQNIVLCGSYMTNNPIINYQLNKYNLKSALVDCVDNQKCYLIDNKNTEIKKQYLKEHYNMDVDFIVEYESNLLKVYKLITK